MKNLILVAALSVASWAHADLMKLVPGSSNREGVNISQSATATVEGRSYPLTTVGAGLRSKKVMFDVNVYVAQLMVADKAAFDAGKSTAEAALAQIGQQPQAAIRLTFLRDVDADTIATQFQDALDANHVDSKDAEVRAFMKMVTDGDYAQKDGSLTMFIAKNADGSETLAYENLSGGQSKVQSKNFSAGFARKLFSIWLGVPADPGLAKLQAELLAGVQ